MIIPELTINEVVNNLDKGNFFKKYGNPVRVEIDGENYAILSIELYERMFGKAKQTDKNKIEIEDFFEGLKSEYLVKEDGRNEGPGNT